ncbi:glycosyltransferase [Pseudalkalibacillus hwajinpoensis]|uniref:glycosyltransferase n=1 Tax=Guptibacillus hwajinpoensis TaxID=208199 RepID=UPI00325ACB71
MMLKRKILVPIAFNNWALTDVNDNRLTKEWIDHRMGIFMKYTCKSLKAQTNQDFTTILQYDQRSEEHVLNALKQHDPLPENIKFVPKNAYNKTLEREIQDYDEVYFARIDSDDMYHKGYFEFLKNHQPAEGTEALINQYGYFYDEYSDKVATAKIQSPPFYTLIYNVAEYLEGKRHPVKGHLSVHSLNHELLEPRNYVQVIHSNNMSTSFENRYIDGLIEDENEKNQILQNFWG